MRELIDEAEYNPAEENISKRSISFSEFGEAKVETAQEFSTIYQHNRSRIIKPGEVLMNLILPTLSNRLKYHFESRKLKILSLENSDLNEIDSTNHLG